MTLDNFGSNFQELRVFGRVIDGPYVMRMMTRRGKQIPNKCHFIYKKKENIVCSLQWVELMVE